MRCRGCIFAAAGLLAVGLLLLAAVAAGAAGAGHFLVADDGAAQADAILSLGDDQCDGFFRVRYAIDLFEQGYAPVVVLSGGSMADAGLACSSAQLSLEAAQELGLPHESTIIADEAQSTYDEAVNMAKLVRERGWDSVIVVTDVFHTRRAARTFRTLLPETTVYVSAAPDPRYDPARWWANEYSLSAVVNEYIKLLFYWFKYGIRPM